MNDTNAISLPEPSALRPQGWGAEVEVISSDLTEEQRALVIQVKQLSAVVHMAGFERAKRLRLLRDSFPVGGSDSPNQAARMGWADFLRREFDTNVQDVSREISAIEAADDFLDETRSGAPHHGIFDQIGSSHLNEIGRGSTPAIRRQVWDRLFDGKVNLNKRAIRAVVKELNGKKGTTLQVRKPKEPSKSPAKLPTPDPNATGGPTISRSKYGNLPERAQEFKYLKGREAANDKLAEDMAKLLRASAQSGSGKLTRLRVLSEALHREFKSIGERYHSKWDKARHYPRYMTLWQQLWIEEGLLTLHEELNKVRWEVSEANRYSSIANMHLHVDDLEVTE